MFDSSGPDLRVRGTAQQLFEKYLQLGRDSSSVGDRVMAESYFQHAEHYFRILNAINQASQPGQPHYQPGQPQQPQANHYNGNRRPQGEDEQSDDDQHGFGDQPAVETREIPIAVVPEG